MNPNVSLYESGWKFVMAVSGGGQEIIGELTKHGRMSGTLLEATVPYAVPAFHKLIVGQPDQIVSKEAARAAAMACYRRAKAYAPNDNVFGFASTGSVAKVGGEREGREHKVFMAIQDHVRTMGMNFVLGPGRTRLEEERRITDCIRVALMWGCHRFADMEKELLPGDKFDMETYEPHDPFLRFLVNGDIPKLNSAKSRVIFSSSCNPLHQAHINMMEDASRAIQFPVDIELCIQNADKPPLDYLTIKERLAKTEEAIAGNPHIGFIIPTNKPYFFDKAKLFPGVTFVMGMDTFDRIFDSRYYQCGGSDILICLQLMQETGNRFLVYPRKGYKPVVRNYESFEGSLINKVTHFVKPYEGYEASDLSSTQLRREARNAD